MYRSGLFHLCVLPSKESHSKFPLVTTVAIKVSLASDIAIWRSRERTCPNVTVSSTRHSAHKKQLQRQCDSGGDTRVTPRATEIKIKRLQGDMWARRRLSEIKVSAGAKWEESNERFLYVAILWQVDDVRCSPAVPMKVTKKWNSNRVNIMVIFDGI